MMKSIRDMLSYKSNEVFLIDQVSGQETTFTQHHHSASAIANWLHKQGLKKGQMLGIMLENSVLFAEFYFACLYSGIIVVPINPHWPNNQVEFVLSQTKTKYVLINEDFHSKFAELFARLDVVVFTPPLLDIDYQNIALSFENDITPDDIAIIIYTSGSTALPKGVAHKIGSLIDNGYLFQKTLKIDATFRFLNYLPMNYNAGLFNLLLIPYLARSSVVIGPVFSIGLVPHFWDVIAKYHINALWLVPTILSILLATDRDPQGKTYCQSMKRLFIGTAPLRRELKKRFEKRYQIKLYESYGITETLFLCSDYPEANLSELAVGKLFDGIQIKVIDDNGHSLERGKIGELAIKTPHFMQGYFATDPTAYIDKEGFFLTGDVGYLTPENEIILTDRKKDLIIRGGINISPIAIETVLYQHENIELCAVIGIPDEFSGEEIVAVIKPKNNLLSIENELKALCQEQLAELQRPQYYLNLMEFPCTVTGKIQKSKLKEWATTILK